MVFKSTKGMSAGVLITGIILLVIAFSVIGEMIPELNSALTDLNNTGIANTTTDEGLPLRSLFNANGLVVLALMGIIILIIFGFLGLKGKGKR